MAQHWHDIWGGVHSVSDIFLFRALNAVEFCNAGSWQRAGGFTDPAVSGHCHRHAAVLQPSWNDALVQDLRAHGEVKAAAMDLEVKPSEVTPSLLGRAYFGQGKDT